MSARDALHRLIAERQRGRLLLIGLGASLGWLILALLMMPDGEGTAGRGGWLIWMVGVLLPLALICIGGTLSLAALRKSGNLALSASLVKMIGLPIITTLGAWFYGFRGPELGTLFLYFASPTAAASFVMARAANGNHELAAAIIVITTVMAAVTIAPSANRHKGSAGASVAAATHPAIWSWNARLCARTSVRTAGEVAPSSP